MRIYQVTTTDKYNHFVIAKSAEDLFLYLKNAISSPQIREVKLLAHEQSVIDLQDLKTERKA